MRWGIWGARAAIIAVDLLIAAIIVLSILPLASGNLKVEIPNEDVGKPTFDGDIVRFSMPVKVYNGGYFDITDFKMHFTVGEGGDQIAEYTSPAVAIVTGKTTTVDIVLELDLGSISTADLQRLVFQQTELDLRVGAEAAYSLGLVRAQIHLNQTMNWEPLIRDVMVDTNNVHVNPNGSSYDISIPYSFGASDLIAGYEVTLFTTLSNSTSLIGTSSQVITLQGYNNGMFTFTVDQAALSEAQTFFLGTDMSFEGATMHRDSSFYWPGGWA